MIKTTNHIIRRSILLLALSERIYLETLKEDTKHREKDKEELLAFLEHFDYMKFLSSKERDILHAPIASLTPKDCCTFSYSYYSISVLLWSVGLLIDWQDETVNYYELLQINKNHSLADIAKKTSRLEVKELTDNKDIALLIHWRTRVISAIDEKVKEQGIVPMIVQTFGKQYESLLSVIRQINEDFMFGDMPFYKLSQEEKESVSLKLLWKHHAFEWLLSNEEWEDIYTTT